MIDFIFASAERAVISGGLIYAALQFALPNGAVKAQGAIVGRTLAVAGQKIGKDPARQVGRYVAGTVSAFVEGLIDGLETE